MISERSTSTLTGTGMEGSTSMGTTTGTATGTGGSAGTNTALVVHDVTRALPGAGGVGGVGGVGGTMSR